MKVRPVTVIVLVQLVFAAALLAVAWSGMHGRATLRRDLADTQAELGRTRAALVVAQNAAASATARADRLQARVDALETLLRREGIDPGTVVIVQPARDSTRASASPSATPRASSNPRPASASPSASPSPRPSPTCRVPLPLVGCP